MFGLAILPFCEEVSFLFYREIFCQSGSFLLSPGFSFLAKSRQHGPSPAVDPYDHRIKLCCPKANFRDGSGRVCSIASWRTPSSPGVSSRCCPVLVFGHTHCNISYHIILSYRTSVVRLLQVEDRCIPIVT